MSKSTFTRTRKLGILLNVLLSSGLALAVGGLLIYLGYRPEVRQRLDLTRGQEFTLDDKTLRILENLDQDVKVYACFRPSDVTQNGQMVRGLGLVIDIVARYTDGLLREYELRGGGRVEARIYDPTVTAHIGRIQDLQRKLGEPAANVVVVEAGERRVLLRLDDLAEYEQRGGVAVLRDFEVQQAVSSAILTVTEAEPIRVAWIWGHGERDPEGYGTDRAGRGGYSKVARDLLSQNCVIQKLPLAEFELSPAQFDVAILAAPTEELPAGQMEQISRYVEAGGRLLALFERDTPIGLDTPLLDRLLGLQRLDGMVCIRSDGAVYQRRPVIFTEVMHSAQHPITRPLADRELQTMWDSAVSFQTLGRPEHADLLVQPLARTRDEVGAWLDLPPYNERFDPATERPGMSLDLAYAVEFPAERGSGRVVVVGDSDLFDDVHINGLPGNQPFVLNAFEWLAGREQLIALPPQRYDELRVDLTVDEYETIFLYVVILIPAGALLAALAVFWMRRY